MNKEQSEQSWKQLNDQIIELYSSGKYGEAIPIGQQARELAAKIWGQTHPKVATSCNNLAMLYETQNRLGEAEPLYLEAIDIDRKTLDAEHSPLVTHLNNLASLYETQNRLEEAEPLYLEVIDIDRKALPIDYSSLATHLNNLAMLYETQNRLEEAEILYLEAIDIDKKALPIDHPSLATHLNNLASLLAKTDRPKAAFKLMLRASKVQETNIQRYFGSSSESERLAYLESIRGDFEGFLSLIYQHLPDSNAAKQAALNLVLKRKALTSAVPAACNSPIFAERYPHLQDKFGQWQQLSDKLLQLSYDIPGPEELAFRQEELALVQKQRNDLEKQLAREVPEIQLQKQTGGRKAVALCLPAGASLVEFVRFRLYNLTEDRYQDTRYLAFILPAGQPGQVEMVDLGDAAAIDNLIAQYRYALVTQDKSSNAESESAPPAKLDLYNKNAGSQLREAVFDKLRPYLGSCRNLVLAPDGDLNLAPLGILPLEVGERNLRDEYAIHSVSSGRELLRNNIEVGREPGPALTVGAPNYDLGRGDNSPPADDSEKPAATVAGWPFQHIRETGDLAAAVGQRLGAEALFGDAALMGELLARRSPKVLLVATHGFFFYKGGLQDYYQFVLALLRCPKGEEENILQQHEHLLDKELLEVMAEMATQLAENDNEETANWLRQFAQLVEEKINAPAPSENDAADTPSAIDRLDAEVEDPMLRVGIALAGANTWSCGGKLPPKAGTGIMFARDMAALDLMATELVILAACQSGLGDIPTGEGVLGLRRAVAVAGAKALIMSLWSVPTYATILLMERLFDNIDAGWQPAEALEMAQDYVENVTVGELKESELGEKILRNLEIMVDTTSNSNLLEMKPLEHPYYWGAWVCQGCN
ncbi:MAG: CHAT domain-containing tetratricopeptide repeat protein [Cyanobacteriota bacterium]|nr:CHAT domain-containing tetratricopeptide repeat protein [Cyanobacteriota bacterium]